MSAHSGPQSRADLVKLSLGALGVVYGDIGTSPLYAMKECFTPPHGTEVTSANVLGILSLFFWALTLVIVVKYLTFVMRADNKGEGGTFALIALIDLAGMTMFGTALPFTVSVAAAGGWLAAVAVIAVIASAVPAWRASRLVVREALAYT